jgi:hypothetical protein
MSESRSASFSSSQLTSTTERDSDSGQISGGSVGTYSNSAFDADLSQVSATGNYTSASGTYTETGNITSDDDNYGNPNVSQQ